MATKKRSADLTQEEIDQILSTAEQLDENIEKLRAARKKINSELSRVSKQRRQQLIAALRLKEPSSSSYYTEQAKKQEFRRVLDALARAAASGRIVIVEDEG